MPENITFINRIASTQMINDASVTVTNPVYGVGKRLLNDYC